MLPLRCRTICPHPPRSGGLSEAILILSGKRNLCVHVFFFFFFFFLSEIGLLPKAVARSPIRYSARWGGESDDCCLAQWGDRVPLGTLGEVWGRLWLSHWGCPGPRVDGGRDAAVPPQHPGRPCTEEDPPSVSRADGGEPVLIIWENIESDLCSHQEAESTPGGQTVKSRETPPCVTRRRVGSL